MSPKPRSFFKLTQPTTATLPSKPRQEQEKPIQPPEPVTAEQKKLKNTLVEILVFLPKEHFKYHFIKEEIEQSKALVGIFNPTVLKENVKTLLQKNGFLCQIRHPSEQFWKTRIRDLTNDW